MITSTFPLAHREVRGERVPMISAKLRRPGISISSTPIAVDDATADVAIFLMLGALRQITIPMTAIRDGKFRGKTPIGHDPKGKTLGILGMGGIGRVNICPVCAVVFILFLTSSRHWLNELGHLV